MLASGLQVWESPDILSWSGWIDRELDAARARHERIACRLSTLGSWLLWREAVTEVAADLDVLAPELLVDSIRRADELLEDWGLELGQAVTAESALLLRARAHYRGRCAELGVIDGGSWRSSRAWLHPSAHLWLTGFSGALGAARGRWLADQGAVIDGPGEFAGTEPARGRLVQLSDAMLEAEAASAWCAQALRKDGAARLLLVVPRLREQRHLWQQALADSLDEASILRPEAPGPSCSFAIEGGEPLGAHPIVAAAINAIVVVAGEAAFEHWSLLLRSPFFAALPRRECLRLELWQRERNVDSGELPALLQLLPTIVSELGGDSAPPLRELFDALTSASPTAGAAGAVASRDHWARTLAALLGRLGWPGAAALDEQALQAKLQFEALLGEFAAAEPLDQRLTLIEAAALLQRLVARTALDTAMPEAAVTVTASIEDPIVRYDGLWAAGLCAAAWPQAARPDALLPLPLQLQAGIPSASATGQLQRARAAQQQWLRASADCVLSWPQSEGDLPQDPSPLLIEVGAADSQLQRLASAPAAGLERRLADLAPALHHFNDVSGPAWPQGRPLRGGAKLLELQSLCPFRAFSELRLQAQPLLLPSPGIEPHQRGRIVHQALELFWRATPDLATLLARSETETSHLAKQCAERAVGEIAMTVPRSLQSVLLARECARTAELIEQLIKWERTRAPFATQELESQHTLALAGTTLRVRLDRVDRLEDGRLVVIDYKSGRARSFDPYEARPQQPQLPAYAAVFGERVAAVLAVYLDGEGVQLKGFADRPDRLRGLTAAPNADSQWQALQRRWSELLQSLAQEFVDGYAPVAPQPGVCDRCQLQLLCRVAPEQLEVEEAGGADDSLAAEAGSA